MLKVLIFKSAKNLEAHLESLLDDKTDNKRFIYFGELDTDACNLLEKYAISEVKRSRHNEKYKNQFLQEYVDLIGTIGKEQNSRTWWATDIASKNRFTSKLPFFLHQFLTNQWMHRDLLDKKGEKQKTPILAKDYSEALTFAEYDIKSNWKMYKQNFMVGG